MGQHHFNWVDCIDVFLDPRYRVRCFLFQLFFGLFLIVPAVAFAVPRWLMLIMLTGYCVCAPFWIAPVFVMRELERQRLRATPNAWRRLHSPDH